MTNSNHGYKGTLITLYMGVSLSVPIVEERDSLSVVINLPLPPSTNDSYAEIVVHGAEVDVAWLLALIKSSLTYKDRKWRTSLN